MYNNVLCYEKFDFIDLFYAWILTNSEIKIHATIIFNVYYIKKIDFGELLMTLVL